LSTVVGYGDLTPRSWLGRALASILMFTGIVLMALPIGVVSSHFQELYVLTYNETEEEIAEEDELRRRMLEQDSLDQIEELAVNDDDYDDDDDDYDGDKRTVTFERRNFQRMRSFSKSSSFNLKDDKMNRKNFLKNNGFGSRLRSSNSFRSACSEMDLSSPSKLDQVKQPKQEGASNDDYFNFTNIYEYFLPGMESTANPSRETSNDPTVLLQKKYDEINMLHEQLRRAMSEAEVLLMESLKNDQL
jgi:hypothetical protein